MEMDRQLPFFQPFFFTETLRVRYYATVDCIFGMYKLLLHLSFFVLQVTLALCLALCVHV